MHLEMGVYPGGFTSEGGSASGGIGQTPLRYMGYYGLWSTSRWYASYWNAFLFIYTDQLSFFVRHHYG